MLAQRYALIQQRILRHPLFRPTIVSSHFGNQTGGGNNMISRSSSLRDVQHKLIPIECLLGGGSNGSTTVLVLGMLVQIEEGQYYIEDLTGQVPVVFPNDESLFETCAGFYITELSILLTEGQYVDGLFYIHRIGQPLQETRVQSLQAIQKQVKHTLYDSKTVSSYKIGNENESKISTASFVVIFTKYESYDIEQLPCFILMGNFCSPLSYLPRHQQQYYFGMSASSSSQGSSATTDMHRTVAAIEEILKLIETFPKLARYGHFCFVGGPNDYSVLGSAHLHPLPYPPLSSIMKRNLVTMTNYKKITNVHYISNPGRIVWRGKEIVIFRYDILQRFQQYQLLMQSNNHNYQNQNGLLSPSKSSTPSKLTTPSKSPGANDSVDDLSMELDEKDENEHVRLPHCRLVKTILDQGHLVPIPNVPIYWNYDSALRLYPLPDLLIVGGDIASATSQHPHYDEWYGGCHIIHPAAFTTSNNNNNTTTTKSSNDTTTMSSSYALVTIDTAVKPSQQQQQHPSSPNQDDESIYNSSSVEFCTI